MFTAWSPQIRDFAASATAPLHIAPSRVNSRFSRLSCSPNPFFIVQASPVTWFSVRWFLAAQISSQYFRIRSDIPRKKRRMIGDSNNLSQIMRDWQCSIAFFPFYHKLFDFWRWNRVESAGWLIYRQNIRFCGKCMGQMLLSAWKSECRSFNLSFTFPQTFALWSDFSTIPMLIF